VRVSEQLSCKRRKKKKCFSGSSILLLLEKAAAPEENTSHLPIASAMPGGKEKNSSTFLAAQEKTRQADRLGSRRGGGRLSPFINADIREAIELGKGGGTFSPRDLRRGQVAYGGKQPSLQKKEMGLLSTRKME